MKLKSAFYIISGLALLITLVTGGALDVITSNMRQEFEEAENTGNALIVTQSLMRKIGVANRLNNTWIFDRKNDVKVRRDQARMESYGTLEKIEEEAGTPEDNQFFRTIRRSIQKLYADQDQISAQGLPKNPAQTLENLSNLLDKILKQFEPFIQSKSHRLLALTAESRYYENLSSIIGRCAAGSSVLLFIILIWTLQKSIVDPLYNIVTTIINFQKGDKKARVNLRNSRIQEVKAAGIGFNDLADSIETLDRRRIEYLVGIAHDLKNPVTAMKTGLSLLHSKQRLLAPEKQRELIKIISLQTTRLECMISDWMEVQRVEDGDLNYEMKPVDIREIVGESVLLWQQQGQGHEILTYSPDQPLMVECDPGRIARVVNNLLSNAIKYSPNGGSIQVRVEREDLFAKLTVKDHGLGISKEDLSHLFEPFRRSIAVKDIPGVGIGLSTSQKLIKAHGGEIAVQSALNAGSTFVVRLPLTRVLQFRNRKIA